jgi:hypothetical protein
VRYDLDNPQQATALMLNLWPKVKEALSAGQKMTIEIKPASKSRDQERKYHAILRDIAEQSQHMGSVWDADDWKRLLVWQYCKEKAIDSGKVVPSLDMTGVVQLGQQTRKFTKEQASEFVDYLNAWCVEHGVETNEKAL